MAFYDTEEVRHRMFLHDWEQALAAHQLGKFIANTPLGERWFASEKHWAEYTGNPVMPEGHYGLQAQHDEEVEMGLEAQEEERLRAENQFDLNNAMGF